VQKHPICLSSENSGLGDVFERGFSMNVFRLPLIAALMMISSAAAAQQSKPGIRVIGPDSEHIYSADPAAPTQLLDDEALQLQNERALRAKIWREQRADARRREEVDAERARLAAATAYQESDQGWSYGGPFVSGQFRRAFGRQIRRPSAMGIGSSSHHR
jgi:hypothetical protein